MSSKTIYYSDAPCGSGKTRAINQFIKHHPGIYVFAVNKIDIMDERAKQMAAPKVDIFKIKHDIGNIQNQINAVAKSLVDWKKLCLSTHAIVYVTHEALKTADFSAFASLEAVRIIDEQYNVLELIHSTMFSTDFWRRIHDLFQLENPNDKYSRLILSEAGEKLEKDRKTVSDVEQGYWELARKIKLFKVIVESKKWTELTTDAYQDEDRRIELHYFVEPLGMEHFIMNIVLADNLEKTTMFKFWRDQFGIEWQAMDFGKDIDTRAVPLEKRVRIHYFSEHRVSRKIIDTNRHAIKVTEYFKANTPTNYVWSVNDKYNEGIFDKVFAEKDYVSPKSAGTNEFIDRTTAVCLLSHRPRRQLVGAAKIYFPHVTEQDFLEANEYDAIHQMVMRSKLRDYASDKVVDIYVWDHEQAFQLMNYMGIRGEPIHIPNVVKEIIIPARGKGKTKKSKEEKRAAKAESQRKYRANLKLKKQQAAE